MKLQFCGISLQTESQSLLFRNIVVPFSSITKQLPASFTLAKGRKKICAHKLTPDPQPRTSGLVSPCSQCRSDFKTFKKCLPEVLLLFLLVIAYI